MGRYFRTVQEIYRKNPDYKYVVEIRSSPGLLGGFDVTVQGLAQGTDNVDDNENFLSEWYWRRPSREKLMELVDRLHISVRTHMDEKDWDAKEDAKIAKHLEDMKKQMEEQFRRQLEQQLAQKAKQLKDKMSEDNPLI